METKFSENKNKQSFQSSMCNLIAGTRPSENTPASRIGYTRNDEKWRSDDDML